MMPIRVGVICDFREEGWHSMDLVADMLLDTLPAVSPGTIAATRLQPAMRQRFSRLPLLGRHRRAPLADRITGRFYDYPRWLLGIGVLAWLLTLWLGWQSITGLQALWA